MKKVLLVMCFLGAANLFAESCNSFCSSIVFQKNSAFIKTDAVPVVKTICDKYGILEPICELIEFRDDGSAWLQESSVEDFYTYCKTCSNVVEQKEQPGWIQRLSNVTFRR